MAPTEAAAVARVLAGRGLVPGAVPRGELLPLLQALQADLGWLPRGALHALAEAAGLPFPDVWGVVTFYALLALEPPRGVRVHVCDDVSCRLAGAEPVLAELEARHGPPRRFAGLAHGPDEAAAPAASGGRGRDGACLDWETVPCLGQCDRGPVAVVAGRLLLRAGTVDVEGAARAAGSPPAQAGSQGVADDRRRAGGAGRPQEVRHLLARVGRVDPASLPAYRGAGGYRALHRAVELGPAGVLAELEASGLLGRGGAAFPAGVKWRAVANAVGRRRVVCNGDESEPGTFKDRVLMEEDPFSIVEALTIAGLTVGAAEGVVYVRGEYELAAARLEEAIRQAEAAGLLGAGVAGTGQTFALRVFRGAGAYICGEETALFNSLEGRRGEPRNKPPFPTEVGLFGGPTLVNNVETLANVPLVLNAGAAAFRVHGTERSTGTKLFCVSGHVERPGLYEVAFGTTLGDMLEIAGGVAGGRRLQAILCGGAAGTFLGPERLDVRLTFEDLRAVGATVGSGALVFLDETVPLWQVVRRIARFFREESCGQCVPCRVGTERQLAIVERLAAGTGRADDAELLEDLAAVMTDASICGLGQTAANAVLSALRLGGDGGAAAGER